MTDPQEPADDSVIDKTVVASAEQLRKLSNVDADAQSRVGQHFGEFKLLRRLGKGGMAEVWLAEQSKPKRHVALKFMHAELMSDALYVKRFEREADAAAGLTHPNIVQVYSTGTTQGQHYIVQEFVEGQTLRDYLKKLSTQQKKITVTAALQIMRQTAAALEAASAKGIVHRDIKPENIMLTEKGMVKVADFGLAQIEQGGEHLHLTQADTTMGTPLYMSPEQIRAEKLDQRSDLYSFGVMSYHMLCGQTPFKGESAMAVAVQHLNDPPPSLLERRSDLPKPLCNLVHKLIRKKPEDRYQSFTEVLDDIRAMSKANKSGNLSEVMITATSADNESSPSRRVFGQNPILTLALLVLLTGTASAGVGWLMRARIGAPVPTQFPKEPTAKDQYMKALFLGDSEEAWKAVGTYFRNDGNEKLWVDRAEEQLLLLYLKDKSREADAQKQIDVLMNMGGSGDKRFFLEARLAKAYLAAGRGDFPTAREIIGADRPQFETNLSGSWIELFQGLSNRSYRVPPGGSPGRPNDRRPGDRNPEPGNPPQGGEN
jgi:serine/threonine protein kinase